MVTSGLAGVASCVSVGYDCGQVESIRGMVLRGVDWRGRSGEVGYVLVVARCGESGVVSLSEAWSCLVRQAG
jgi:hypothetical protein